jgi:hypothetical protein
MAPQQDSLSGVIICPASRRPTAVRANSIAATDIFITRWAGVRCQLSRTLGTLGTLGTFGTFGLSVGCSSSWKWCPWTGKRRERGQRARSTGSQVVYEHFQLDAASRKHTGSSLGDWTETGQLPNPSLANSAASAGRALLSMRSLKQAQRVLGIRESRTNTADVSRLAPVLPNRVGSAARAAQKSDLRNAEYA